MSSVFNIILAVLKIIGEMLIGLVQLILFIILLPIGIITLAIFFARIDTLLADMIITDEYLADCGIENIILLPDKEYTDASYYIRVFNDCSYNDYTRLTESITEYFGTLDYPVFSFSNTDESIISTRVYPLEEYSVSDFSRQDCWDIGYQYDNKLMHICVTYDEENSTISVNISDLNHPLILMISFHLYELANNIPEDDTPVIEEPVPVG